MTDIEKIRWQLCGWVIFILSALFFIVSSIRAGDPASLAGGILFLLACFVFILPLLAMPRDEPSNSSPRRRYFRYPRDWFRAARSRLRAPAAPMTPPAPGHHRQQSQPLRDRWELRFYASTR